MARLSIPYTLYINLYKLAREKKKYTEFENLSTVEQAFVNIVQGFNKQIPIGQ